MSDKNNKLERILAENLPGLFGFLRGMSLSKDEAEDVIQETCEKIIKNVSTAEVINLKAYMYKTARNITLNEFRRTKNKNTALEVLRINYEVIQPNFPEKTYEAEQELQQVLDAINTLPPKCRQVFILKHVEQLPYREIADKMGISVGTVEKHLAKGIRQTHIFFKAIQKGQDIRELLKKEAI